MKTQSVKMRSILYLLWEKDHLGYPTAEDYYQAKMEAMITVLLKRLDPPPPEEPNG